MKSLKKYCEKDNKLELRKLPSDLKQFFLNNIYFSVQKFKNKNNIYRKRSIEIFDIISKPEVQTDDCFKNLKGLTWIGNSCYLDSVLFSFLAIQNNFVDNHILDCELSIRNTGFECYPDTEYNYEDIKIIDYKNRVEIQKKLKLIVQNIRSGKKKNCTDLRKALKKCPNAYLFYGSKQAEAGEFLNYILKIFDTNLAIKKYTTYGSFSMVDDITSSEFESSKTSEYIDYSASIIHFVPVNNLLKNSKNNYYELRSFLELTDDSGILEEGNEFGDAKYIRKIGKTTLIDTPYLIFNLNRLFGGTFYRTKIIPNEIITLDNLKSFILSSIVVYEDSHYTCYFRCGEKFYYYDDMSSKILKVGGYDKLLNHISNPNVMTNGVLYFYTHSESVNILDKEKLINDIDESFVDFFKKLDDENAEIDD
jgi:hypothetical protein